MLGLLGECSYDIVLTSDTLYSSTSIKPLVQCLDGLLSECGEALVAAKRYYFGIGGSTEALMEEVSKCGKFKAEVVRVFDDGKSNLREIVKLSRLSPSSKGSCCDVPKRQKIHEISKN